MAQQLTGEKADLDSVELREIIALEDRRREHIFPAPPSHNLSISPPTHCTIWHIQNIYESLTD
jgi:hypothetical protein